MYFGLPKKLQIVFFLYKYMLYPSEFWNCVLATSAAPPHHQYSTEQNDQQIHLKTRKFFLPCKFSAHKGHLAHGYGNERPPPSRHSALALESSHSPVTCRVHPQRRNKGAAPADAALPLRAIGSWRCRVLLAYHNRYTSNTLQVKSRRWTPKPSSDTVYPSAANRGLLPLLLWAKLATSCIVTPSLCLQHLSFCNLNSDMIWIFMFSNQ